MELDAILLYTQHYKVRIKGDVEQSTERSSTPTTLWGKGNIRVAFDYYEMIEILSTVILDPTKLLYCDFILRYFQH